MVGVIERKYLLGLSQALVVRNDLKKILLALEVDIQRALGDAGLAGDLAHARAIETLSQEHLARPFDNLPTFGALDQVNRCRLFFFDDDCHLPASPRCVRR